MTDTNLKQTSLHDAHVALGATMVPFAGWEMPVSYPGGTVKEVEAVRQNVGVFDVSHMGEARVFDIGASDYLQRVTANNVAKLRPGKAQYSLLLNENGGTIDDIIVYCVAPDNFLVVLNAGCKDKDWHWLALQQRTRPKPDVVLDDVSDDTALLAVQGPRAVELVDGLRHTGDAALPSRFEFVTTRLQDIPESCVLSRTGYTGEDGFEIFCRWEDAPVLWNKLLDAGAAPCGLGARDVLRLEAAYPLYGHELDADHMPEESGVAWAVKLGKGDFIGRDALTERMASHKLVGLRMTERAIPREHCPVLSEGGAVIGEVTSGTLSPTLNAGIALARIDAHFALPDAPLLVDIRGRQAKAVVVPLPFYRNGV